VRELDCNRAREEFHRNFTERGELGAGLVIFHRGEEVLQVHGGWCDRQRTAPWTEETAVLVWSATKGPAAAALLHALERRGAPVETKVAEVWPEFAAAGKEHVTIADVLSHRAGLAGLATLDRSVSLFDHEAVAAALAAQKPLWPPGTAHGYGPRTYGFLLDELVRRLTGMQLGRYWRQEFAEPMALRFFIGTEPEDLHDIANIYAAPAGPPAPEDEAFNAAFADRESITARAFATPMGLPGVSAMNTLPFRMASLPAFGGIGTARALAKFYALLGNGGEWDGRRFFAEETVRMMERVLSSGLDLTLCKETAFSVGFMLDPVDAHGVKKRRLFGPSSRAFGHPGAGGSIAFADRENGVALAYVMNQMEPGVLPGGKAGAIMGALYG
jgi:CubicO group peptidase (beta-lactamase class C family)